MKLTQLEKVHDFYVNELKLIQVELFPLFHLKNVADVSELFVWPCKQKINIFYSILTFHFKLHIIYT